MTRVTDAFRYELQKEVDTSRRRTILRRTVDEGEFSALVFGHLYVHISVFIPTVRSTTVNVLSQLSRASTCVHFPFDPPAAPYELRPFLSHLHFASVPYLTWQAPLHNVLPVRHSSVALILVGCTATLSLRAAALRRRLLLYNPSVHKPPCAQHSWTLTD